MNHHIVNQAELADCQDEAYSAKLATKRYRERLQSAKVRQRCAVPAGSPRMLPSLQVTGGSARAERLVVPTGSDVASNTRCVVLPCHRMIW